MITAETDLNDLSNASIYEACRNINNRLGSNSIPARIMARKAGVILEARNKLRRILCPKS